ncbi:hypothetical protein [Nocardiopsis ansamitocini]|uniref:Uncharacterized protein n=1 Tax=Nocardiopsis ansamitocini TaxID=1670832 RepID=A0A9W6P6B0_9ACTN|nr:hypothetical protein [Nocardiopsis ansamitocini]GLU47936.1 hypothetical protein Nans01_22870 [Nocardiopsis ansamitocini]
MSGPDDERWVVFDDHDLLPDTTADERGESWGEAGDERSRLEEMLRDVPPHWG